MRVLPRVFRLGGAPASFRARLSAVAAWMGDDGFFIGLTAAYLLRLDGVDRPTRIDVARRSQHGTPSWIRVHRLEAKEVTPLRRVHGFRIPCVERVLVECAATLPVSRVARAVDDALRRRLTTLERTKNWLAGPGRNRKGARVLRRVLQGRDDRDPRVRSHFEAKMLAILRRIAEHRFHADFEIQTGGARYVIDFYCPTARLGIECHSYKWHIGQHNSDAIRDRRIRALGVEIIYFTWDDVRFHPREVEREIRDALVRRASLFSTKCAPEAQDLEK